jgi:hypothetical protein
VFLTIAPLAVRLQLASIKQLEYEHLAGNVRLSSVRHFVNNRMMSIFVGIPFMLIVIYDNQNSLFRERLWVVAYALIMAYDYFATDFQSGGKSWLRRGLDLLKQGISSLKPAPRWSPGAQGA